MFCQNCGKEVTGNFCQNCGASVVNPSAHIPLQTPIQTPHAQTNSNTTKLFKIFSIISSVFCGFSLLSYLLSTLTKDSTDTRASVLMIGFSLFFVMASIPATIIQPSKQGLSALFYALSCAGLLFIGFMGTMYSVFVTLLCIVSVVLIIVTAVLGKKVQTEPLQTKKVIAVFVCLLILSVGIIAGERITNQQRNNRLSNISINGVSFSKEQLDIIDEDYIIRRSMQRELTTEKLEDFNYKKSESQSAIIPGTEYYASDYPECNYLQIENSFLSQNSNGTLSTYNVEYSPVKLDNENLKKVIDVYSTITGDKFSCDNDTYTFSDILSAQLPEEGFITYTYLSPADADTDITISIRVNRNGYATLEVNYLFPEVIQA